MAEGRTSRRELLQHGKRLRSDLACAEIFTALADAGLEAMLLRGPAIARRLYAEGERGYRDLDLLVAEAAREPAGRALSGLGYGHYGPAGPEQLWRRPVDGSLVDLHVSLWGVSGSAAVLWRELWSRRTTLAVAGVEATVPDEAGTVFVIVLHASQHGVLVPHAQRDLERALARFDRFAWADAARCAAASGSLVAFRQGLTGLAAGRSMLAELELEPLASRQALLRQHGVQVPAYLFESLGWRERLAILRGRIAPSRGEVAAFVEPRAADSTAWLLLAHGRRVARLPGRTLRLIGLWRRAGRAPAPGGRRRA